ncbi:MAG: hypothetical protein JWR67_2027 [Mucilaginibacter sp.]|nr:hypothetical protein [Mucilaginibacter sp.]
MTSFIDAIEELESKLFDLHPEAEKIYKLIGGLKELIPIEKEIISNDTKVIKLVFDKNASAMEQVLFALKYFGVIAKINEIEKTIKEFDPSFNKGLNTPLDKLKKAGMVMTYNPNGSNHSVYYGLKEWFNKDGSIKEEYIL